MAARRWKRWCCLCGAKDPDPMEMCPVSDVEMGSRGQGLKHLLASGKYESAMRCWNSASAVEARKQLVAREER